MLVARERAYTCTSLIIDPYTTIHGYSPILPTASLQLSPWTVEQAFENMHAFFRLGPTLLTADVPKTADAITPDNTIGLPISGAKGTWSWLQPYAIGDVPKVDSSGTVPAVTTKEDDDTTYGEIPVTEDVGGKRYQKGPYTFVEGYLKLLGSLAAK
jgi:hypothetical protein